MGNSAHAAHGEPSYSRSMTEQLEQKPDDLELEFEEVADLELSSQAADEVRGASGSHAINDRVGKQNC